MKINYYLRKIIEQVQEKSQSATLRYAILSGIASAINYFSLIIFGRVFSVEDYGIASSLLAFTTNAGVFMVPLQIIVCKQLAGQNAKHDSNDAVLASFKMINVIEMMLFVILYRPIVSYLSLENVLQYMIVVATVFSTNISFVATGVAQGRQKFILLGLSTISIYILKAIIGIGLGIAGFSPVTTLIGMMIAQFVSSVIILRICSYSVRKVFFASHLDDFAFVKEYLGILVLYFVVSLYMNNGDLLLGGVNNSKGTIGLYTVAISLSKISIFLITTPIATVLLPKLASMKERRKKVKMLLVSEGLSVMGALIYGGGLIIFGKPIIIMLYGINYVSAINYVIVTVFYSVILSGYYIFYQYALATSLVKCFTNISVIVSSVVIAIVLVLKMNIHQIPILMAGGMITSVIFCFLIEGLNNNEN